MALSTFSGRFKFEDNVVAVGSKSGLGGGGGIVEINAKVNNPMR